MTNVRKPFPKLDAKMLVTVQPLALSSAKLLEMEHMFKTEDFYRSLEIVRKADRFLSPYCTDDKCRTCVCPQGSASRLLKHGLSSAPSQPVQRAKKPCGCGVARFGGIHSDWCPSLEP